MIGEPIDLTYEKSNGYDVSLLEAKYDSVWIPWIHRLDRAIQLKTNPPLNPYSYPNLFIPKLKGETHHFFKKMGIGRQHNLAIERKEDGCKIFLLCCFIKNTDYSYEDGTTIELVLNDIQIKAKEW